MPGEYYIAKDVWRPPAKPKHTSCAEFKKWKYGKATDQFEQTHGHRLYAIDGGFYSPRHLMPPERHIDLQKTFKEDPDAHATAQPTWNLVEEQTAGWIQPPLDNVNKPLAPLSAARGDNYLNTLDEHIARLQLQSAGAAGAHLIGLRRQKEVEEHLHRHEVNSRPPTSHRKFDCVPDLANYQPDKTQLAGLVSPRELAEERPFHRRRTGDVWSMDWARNFGQGISGGGPQSPLGRNRTQTG